jgi:hypothetical protein
MGTGRQSTLVAQTRFEGLRLLIVVLSIQTTSCREQMPGVLPMTISRHYTLTISGNIPPDWVILDLCSGFVYSNSLNSSRTIPAHLLIEAPRQRRPRISGQLMRGLMANNQAVFVEASSQKLSDLRAAKREWSRRLLQPSKMKAARALSAPASPAPSQNVVGVGIGEKIIDGKPTGIMAVKFLVRVKYPENQVDKQSQLPETIDGLPVDVEQVGLFRRFTRAARRASAQSQPTVTMPNPRTRIRPAQPGCSIGFEDSDNQFVMAGTFGAVVTKNRTLFILSNNHVLADENRLPVGTPIFQPGLLDRGDASADQIAELARFVPLRPGASNSADCAIAKVVKKSLVSKAILYVGAPQGVAAARIDMVVHKFGRTTGYRAGRVTSANTDVGVQYETGKFIFGDQIIIVGLNGQSFSDSGDSGSLILERGTQKAVGLLFAGSPSHTLANHLTEVLERLDVTLA